MGTEFCNSDNDSMNVDRELVLASELVFSREQREQAVQRPVLALTEVYTLMAVSAVASLSLRSTSHNARPQFAVSRKRACNRRSTRTGCPSRWQSVSLVVHLAGQFVVFSQQYIRTQLAMAASR